MPMVAATAAASSFISFRLSIRPAKQTSGLKELIKNDFFYFQKIGFDNNLIAKAITELKL